MLDGRIAHYYLWSNMQKIEVPINKRIITLFDNEYSHTNQATIDYINDEYYSELQKLIENDKRSNIFIYYSLFQTYYAALENMFCHIAAVIQAPFYYYAWIVSYRTSDLLGVVKEINEQGIIKNSHGIEHISWRKIADVIHPNINSDIDVKRNENFALLWGRFASDFLSDDYQEAYNSIKHGLRIKNNAISKLQIDDLCLQGSEYGLEYGKIEEIEGMKVLRKRIINFEPKIFDYAFGFIQGTLLNIKNYLKTINVKGEIEIEQYQLRDNIVKEFLEIEPLSIQTITMQID
jgi:hypothetical protein